MGDGTRARDRQLIDCTQVLEEIELYLDGELRGGIRIEVEQHLGRCSPCMAHSEFQRRLKEMLRSKCGCGDAPPELVERVRTLLARLDDPAG